MRLSARFAASSAVAILSTALLSGPATSQTTTGPASPLPNVTVEAPKAHAPKQVAREYAPRQGANTVASRRTTDASTARTPSFALNSALGRIAKLERAASSCNGGCETSYRVGNAPWVGCSYTGENLGVSSLFSSTCTDTLTYNTYLNCTNTKTFLGATQKEARWICSSLQAGGKLTQEKVAAFKQSGR